MTLQPYLEESRLRVEEDLRNYFSVEPCSTRLTKAMTYSLFAGGKRIRPALVFATCDALKTDPSVGLPIASALEMIHTYSLIHDDLPAMDNDDLRRGQPTNHKVFGEAHAILAGDGLLTEAFHRLGARDWNIPAERRIEVIRILADGAGANGMVGGQALDLEWEDRLLDEPALKKIHINKTGKLLRASVLAAGTACGAAEQALKNLDQYGTAIGLAFQIADDLLDLSASAEELGKATHKDQDRHKATYPGLLGEEESRRRAGALLEEAVASTSLFGPKGETLAALARFIVERRS